ncbi:MAG TPA: GNAT family N-acetyltransferase [Candidatus Aminicenantes bacterium]|nr:GNAT family N-acetyltransferase [Candidatus Aminicenantes bacterium]
MSEVPPEIEVRIVTSLPGPQLVALYEEAGWWQPGAGDDESVAEAIVRRSFAFAAAFCGDRLIGMARCITDGVSDAYLQDVMVTRDFRRRGIAARLVRTLIAHLHTHRIGWIGLIAQPGSEEFYARLGFSRMDDHVPMLYDPRH